MRKAFFAALLVGSTLAASGVTYAGLVATGEVNIWTDATTGLLSANGTLRAARNSADNVQYIGCVRYAYDTGSNSALCYARMANGTYASCSTSDANMISVAETMSSAAYLYFVVNADTWSCDRVISTLASQHM